MTRSVPEWRGKTDDSAPPPRVRDRVFEAKGHRCHRCTREIPRGDKWTCEHLVAIVNGGENRQSNLDVTCDWCLPAKNAEDVAIKSKTYAMRSKSNGIRPKRARPMAGTKASGWKQKIGGGWERRSGR